MSLELVIFNHLSKYLRIKPCFDNFVLSFNLICSVCETLPLASAEGASVAADQESETLIINVNLWRRQVTQSFLTNAVEETEILKVVSAVHRYIKP